MAFSFVDLDDRTRPLMLDEVRHDSENGSVYISTRLNDFGKKQYPTLLQSAFAVGTEQTLANELKTGCFNDTEQRKKPKGGYTIASIPANAHEVLAEGEFNRYYIRALCRRAVAEGKKLQVYRAKSVTNPRCESHAKVGQDVDPQSLLTDLRKNIGVDTCLGLPAGPNSGLCVRLT